ncbi:SLAP domain-containing protein [Lactobacillus sp. ESL0679]|uniref:SLAP domain-containing protein n=1 Tax=Lactobacillus sp. ESL0679 TaxID=2983209 RepID=UPI0023F89488|nr:SLAP domain-containing protein [Lactobacillus sp. ESL0679]MDF7683836.1 SLAP domain-containing protein [Lactobacillus sp. ESL0679]
MKKNKKLIVNLAAVILATTSAGSIVTTNQAHAAQTTDQTQDTTAADGTLTLNHNTRIYNKKGQKLYSYQRTNGLLKKGATISYAKKASAIDDPSTVRYSFHDDDWNWFYLPYKTIKGQEYYSIGHGGYVKAINVDKINGNNLYTNQVTGTIKALKYSRKPNQEVILDSNGKQTKDYLKVGQKVTLDRQSNYHELSNTDPDNNGGSTVLYGIKGQNQYLWSTAVNINSRQTLLPYSNYMQVYITKDTNVYTSNGEQYVPKTNSNEIILGNKNNSVKVSKEPQILLKGTIESVIKKTYIKFSNDSKSELCYQLQSTNDSVDKYIKASGTKYIYGKQLQ